MKHISYLLIVYSLLTTMPLFSQNQAIDSITDLLKKHSQADTMRVGFLNELAAALKGTDSKKSFAFATEASKLAHQLKFYKGVGRAFRTIGSYYLQAGEYPNALKYYDSAQKTAVQIGDTVTIAWALNGKGTVFHSQSNYPQALEYYLQAVRLFEKTGKENEAASIMGNAGVLYKEMGELALALTFFDKGLKIHQQLGNSNEIARFLNNVGGIYSDQQKFKEAEDAFRRSLSLSEAMGNKHMMALTLRNLLEAEQIQGNYEVALDHGFRSLELYESLGEKEGIADVCYQLSLTFLKTHKADSALSYARKSLSIAQEIGFNRNIYNTYNVLGMAYAAKKMFPQAYEAQQKFIAYKDTITGEDKQNLVAGLKFQYDLDKKQSQIKLLTKDNQLRREEAKHQRSKMYVLLIMLAFVALSSAILIRNNRQKQKANSLLKQQKEAVQNTLNELRTTQAQLIQREKMASLGELTAGIAHEIQNPLNFVNNFSDINTEMIDELAHELATGNTTEALSIAQNIKLNEEKINHHGKRADSIVKSMLQHSRAGSAEKKPVDINSLVAEYLRLSYHGLRAKDKTFNATFETHFDETIGKINTVPQDIGRVLLNLMSNAFYAVKEKSKQPHHLKGPTYEPTVWITTKLLGNSLATGSKIAISIKDNGTGIPAAVLNKIFQPFFTTKPTGEGTGLGLSVSYDIVKANNGEIKVNSTPGEGTEFIIQLPVL